MSDLDPADLGHLDRFEDDVANRLESHWGLVIRRAANRNAFGGYLTVRFSLSALRSIQLMVPVESRTLYHLSSDTISSTGVPLAMMNSRFPWTEGESKRIAGVATER